MKSVILIILTGLAVSSSAVTNNFQEVSNRRQGISFYKPNYAILGNDPILEMKLQLSFKYRFVDEGTFDSWWSTPVNNLFFAYSQKTFWDLEENSAPYPNNYLDSNFSPELFWLQRGLTSSAWNSQLDLQFGYQHESNGRGEGYGADLGSALYSTILDLGEDGGLAVCGNSEGLGSVFRGRLYAGYR